MEYEELIGIWNSSDAELTNNVQVNRQLIKEVAFKKIRSNLFEIKWASYSELFVGFFWSFFLLSFIADHLPEYKFSLQAFVLLSMSVYGFVLSIHKLKIYFSINPGLSVTKTQYKIECLKRLELKSIQSLYFIIPLFSAPFAIVMTKAVLNIDLYSFGIFGKALLYYTAGAVVVAVIIVFILKKIPGNKDKQLKQSMAFLNELKEFEGGDE
jgi:hypothetical protein